MSLSDQPIAPTPACTHSTVTTAWLGGLVVSGIGAGLAVVALTLPWISVRDPRAGVPVELAVASVPGQGPVFALLLVLTAIAAAVGFTFARQATVAMKAAAALLGAAPAVGALFVGLNPNVANLRAALPDSFTAVWNPQAGAEDLQVSAMGGLTFYIAGLLFIGLGLAIATLNSATRVTFLSAPSANWSSRHVAFVRWSALGAAAPLIVLSLTLAWFEVDTPDGGMPAVAAGWLAIYRVGLVGTLALLVATVLTVGSTQRVLRATGLYVCGGLNAVLAVNMLMVWDPSGLLDRTSVGLRDVHAGPAYLAALGALPLLLAVLAASAPVRTESEEA
jgi:hypothetical protein